LKRCRRTGVTTAVIALQGEGLIHYKRSHTTIFDRTDLEDFIYECYAVVKAEYDRLLKN